MTTPLVWLASASVAASVPVAWWTLAGDRQAAKRITQNLGEYRPTMRAAVLEQSAAERFVGPLARGVGGRLLRFTSARWAEAKTTAIAKAGLTGRATAEQVLGAKVILALAVGGYLLPRLLGQPSGRSLILALGLTVLAFFLPDLFVRARADRRADRISLLLPDVLDQVTISVEAGLGFEAAIARIVQTEDHPLAQEFGRMLQDIQFGTSRADALDALARRSQVDDLRRMVITLRQAESLGVPLARTLRTLALEMREKRRYRAEERAHQLPVKMIFPLGLCILPALLVVILGPAVVSYFELF